MGVVSHKIHLLAPTISNLYFRPTDYIEKRSFMGGLRSSVFRYVTHYIILNNKLHMITPFVISLKKIEKMITRMPSGIRKKENLYDEILKHISWGHE